MKFITKGQDAFYRGFYSNGELILSFSNASFDTILVLAVYQKGDTSLESLEELADEFSVRLKREAGVVLLPYTPKSSSNK
ncbi:MAG: hypothetical protein ACJAUG_003402 [Halioglobus sp.]|jgi:hypothetical protein